MIKTLNNIKHTLLKIMRLVSALDITGNNHYIRSFRSINYTTFRLQLYIS